MSEFPLVELSIPNKESYAREIADAVFELRDEGYELNKFEFVLNFFDEDVGSLLDRVEKGVHEGPGNRSQVTVVGNYRGLPKGEKGGLIGPNPEADDPFENWDKEEKDAQFRMQQEDKVPFERKEVKGIPIEIENRASLEDAFKTAKDASEDRGFETINYNAYIFNRGYDSSLDLLNEVEERKEFLKLCLDRPFIEGKAPVFESEIKYSDNGSEGYFYSDTRRVYHPTEEESVYVPEFDNWDATIEGALRGANLPVMVGNLDHQDNKVIR